MATSFLFSQDQFLDWLKARAFESVSVVHLNEGMDKNLAFLSGYTARMLLMVRDGEYENLKVLFPENQAVFHFEWNAEYQKLFGHDTIFVFMPKKNDKAKFLIKDLALG